MNNKIVGVTALLATFVILAYAVFAANQNAVDNSQACDHASQTGKDNANGNSVLSSCEQPPTSGCGNGICEEGEDLICEPACAA